MPYDDELNADVLEELGRVVTYQQSPNELMGIKVVFGTPRGQESLEPTYRNCWVRLLDFVIAPAAGDVVVDGETVFDVVAVTPDNAGGAWLALAARAA